MAQESYLIIKKLKNELVCNFQSIENRQTKAAVGRRNLKQKGKENGKGRIVKAKWFML